LPDVRRFTMRGKVSWVNAQSWPDAGGCNVLCLTDRQLSIVRQLVWPRCEQLEVFAVPLFDGWYTYPTEELYEAFGDECDELLDKLGKGATVDCSNLQALLQLIADGVAPAEALLLTSSDLNLPAGNSNHTIVTVNAGESAIISLVTLQYVGSTATSLRLYIYRSGTPYSVGDVTPPVSGRLYTFSGPYYLQALDTIQVRIFGATLNDDIIVTANGRLITLPVLS
jgi:hypothetical protein